MLDCVGRSLLIFLISSIFTASVIAIAHAEPRVKVTEKHYSVKGRTASDLRHQMNKRGIRANKRGKTYDAYTRWYVKWHYDYDSRGYRCLIRNVKTEVIITYTMPKWNGESRATQDLRNRWHKYMKALKVHEDGHRDIGISAASEIEKAIGSMGPMGNCTKLGAKANALGNSIIEEHRQKERFYDARTLHGMTQGAVFP